MALINRYQYQKSMSIETIEPLRVRVNDTRRSFEMFLTQRQSALSLIASTPYLMVVHPSVPARTVKEFVQLAKARPGALDMGQGTPFRVSPVRVKNRARGLRSAPTAAGTGSLPYRPPSWPAPRRAVTPVGKDWVPPRM